jgi:hypothetical protein
VEEKRAPVNAARHSWGFIVSIVRETFSFRAKGRGRSTSPRLDVRQENGLQRP